MVIVCVAGCGGDDEPQGPQTRTVSKSGDADFSTIQECINASASRDTCVVQAGTYRERIRFRGRAITVRSSQGAERTIIDGRGGGPVVTFSSDERRDTLLKGFTITNGYASLGGDDTIEHGGGIQMISAGPTIEDCILLDNHADGDGGGIYCFSTGSRPHILNVVFQGNTADRDESAGGQGGGICAVYGRPELTNCLFIENQAADGGAVSARYSARTVLEGCTIANNSADQAWAMYMKNATVETLNSIYWNNSSPQDPPVMMDLDPDPERGDTYFDLSYVNLQGGTENVEFTDACLSNPGRCTTDDDDGLGMLDANPRFVPLSLDEPEVDPKQAFYLSQQVVPPRVDQTVPSPCVDAGDRSEEDAGLEETTTRTDGVADEGFVDLGYHYEATSTTP
jgi:hypothetical protein